MRLAKEMGAGHHELQLWRPFVILEPAGFEWAETQIRSSWMTPDGDDCQHLLGTKPQEDVWGFVYLIHGSNRTLHDEY